MLGTWFYWHIFEKCHLAFGTMFNNIELRRYDKLGTLKQTIKVPLEYAPKEKFLARVENTPDLENPNPVQMQYPRLSFIMNDFRYDSTRKLANNTLCVGSNYNGVPNSYYSHYLPSPYNLSYQLFLIVKYREDAAQILEQILPYFNPLFNLTVNLVPQINEQLTFPLVLNDIDIQDDFEGNFTTNPLIIYTLDFTLKANFYGPIVQNPSGTGLIKTVNLNFGIQFCKTKVTLFYVDEIPLTSPSFDGFYLTDANIDIPTFTIIKHGFETGDVISFVSEKKRILPLITENDYYVFVISANDFKLCISKIDSINANFIVLENICDGVINISEFEFSNV
jgi:T4-like virus Myoviridae tail sheath stabiliser